MVARDESERTVCVVVLVEFDYARDKVGVFGIRTEFVVVDCSVGRSGSDGLIFEAFAFFEFVIVDVVIVEVAVLKCGRSAGR